jgi:hypothetical protein
MLKVSIFKTYFFATILQTSHKLGRNLFSDWKKGFSFWNRLKERDNNKTHFFSFFLLATMKNFLISVDKHQKKVEMKRIKANEIIFNFFFNFSHGVIEMIEFRIPYKIKFWKLFCDPNNSSFPKIESIILK